MRFATEGVGAAVSHKTRYAYGGSDACGVGMAGARCPVADRVLGTVNLVDVALHDKTPLKLTTCNSLSDLPDSVLSDRAWAIRILR